MPTLEMSEPAYLAVANKDAVGKLRFEKFPTPGALLSLKHVQEQKYQRGTGARLQIVPNCAVQRLQQSSNGSVSGVEATKGIIKWSNGKTKVVLCGGAIPNTTMLLNSFPRMEKTAGKRLMGHFVSHITARIPVRAFFPSDQIEDKGLEIAAHNLLGRFSEEKLQYQIQITALQTPDPERDVVVAARECPDYFASATPVQLKGPEEHILFMIAALGETSTANSKHWLAHDTNNSNLTTNVRLQYLLNDTELALWDHMEGEAFEVLRTISQGTDVEYRSDVRNGWTSQKPSTTEIRMKGMVHEASCSFVGPEEEGGSLDNMYRPYGTDNVYVSGAGIFPTAGAWNPTLAMCAYSQDLARKLLKTNYNENSSWMY